MTQFIDHTRRHFIGLGLGALACGVTTPALARWSMAPLTHQPTRSLSFYNLHTDEKLSVAYWKDGSYDHAAWEKINYILRDFRSGNVHVMDLRLMDLLHDVQTTLRNDRPIDIISGYRSPQTNRMLAEASGGVAKNSYHLKGMAIDIRMNGTSLPDLHKTALGMKRGGVGYYPDSQFVHLDVGPIRKWG